MRTVPLFFLLSIALAITLSWDAFTQRQSIDRLFLAEYEQHFISSGNNFSQISLKKNNRYKFLVGLHNGYSPNELQEKLNWTDSLLNAEIELLKENGYLKLSGDSYYSSISIVMQEEGRQLFELSNSIADDIVSSIVTVIPDIKTLYSDLSISNSHKYDELSFFLLSDVLLDNWQINYVEDEFLKSKRPLRHGKRYYLQYAEKDPESNIEVFGIYGNQYTCKEAICYITYGNNRKNHYKKIEELDQMNIPLLTKDDGDILTKMAELFKPELINILDKNRNEFLGNYKNSIYSNEITFEEYFIWYYHFLYTSVTNKLHDQGYLKVPENGIYRIKFEK